MDRRTAIKNIGLGFGVTVSMGTMMSLLQSCGSEEGASAKDGWQPAFLTNKDEFELIEKFTGIIIPRTDTPGAKNLNVIRFIDATVGEVYKPKDQEKFRAGLAKCIEKLEQDQGKKYSKVGYEELTDFLERHIGSKADKAVYDEMMRLKGTDLDAVPSLEPAAQDNYYFYSFLLAVKSMTVSGYFGTEYMGEKVLTYQPVPGPFQGCIDYDGFNNYSL
ncbi:MAG: gluconate 2-dehydrogenase subunit 3 family protein [Bacteroidia bacterium]